MPNAKRHVIGVTRVATLTYPLAYWTVDTGREGPSVLITAAMHGDELHGTEAIRRMLPEIEKDLIKGRCVLVPYTNPCAIQMRQPIMDFDVAHRYIGVENQNINLTWPGKPDGSDAERLAAALKRAVVDEATHLLDLHSWGDYRAPSALCSAENANSIRLAGLVGVPFARATPWMPEIDERPVFPCTLRALFTQTGRDALVIEFSGQPRIIEDQVRMAERAIRNFLRALDLLPGEPECPRPALWLNTCSESAVNAPVNGVFCPSDVQPGDDIEKGRALGHVTDMLTLETHPIEAPIAGRLNLYGPNHIASSTPHLIQIYHGYVEAGEPLARLIPPDAVQAPAPLPRAPH